MGDHFLGYGINLFVVLTIVSLIVTVNRRKVAGQTFTDTLGARLEPIARLTRCPRCTRLRGTRGLGLCLGCGKIVFPWRFWFYLILVNSMSAFILWVVLSGSLSRAGTKIFAILIATLISLGPPALTLMAKVRAAPR